MEKAIQATIPAKQQRLISLDAFRGFTVMLMITVNNPGSWSHVYPPLLHAEWHGITPTDLVFPFFLFIVGVSIVLAYNKRVEAGAPKKDMYKKIISRSLKIFALGMFLSLYPRFDFMNIRIPGVLPRISIVFFACAMLFLNTDWKTQLKLGAGTLLVYWLAMELVPVPEVGAGSLEPGKNLAAWIDSVLIPGRMYRGTWDPEGILSTFPAIVTGITGMLAGKIIVSNKEQTQKLIWLFFGGFIALAAGALFHYIFPINKNLWTSSYVLFTSGLAALTLAASIYFIDILGYKKWTKPGIMFGANAITIYVLSGMLPFLFSYNLGSEESSFSIISLIMGAATSLGASMKLTSLTYAIFFIGICFIPAYILFKKKIFIKV
ncbi:DUF5009 domain-containing protein [Flammeovirgaceae bacterium SG7u.111]|nr:DUF5009 domain-containing protein [Flammeovirgaceae bacterium SG7u.132]WPO38562.1 DUF5009 domain-containing protein [Flammeovirgaceae bacterium SG7u.111]